MRRKSDLEKDTVQPTTTPTLCRGDRILRPRDYQEPENFTSKTDPLEGTSTFNSIKTVKPGLQILTVAKTPRSPTPWPVTMEEVLEKYLQSANKVQNWPHGIWSFKNTHRLWPAGYSLQRRTLISTIKRFSWAKACVGPSCQLLLTQTVLFKQQTVRLPRTAALEATLGPPILPAKGSTANRLWQRQKYTKWLSF